MATRISNRQLIDHLRSTGTGERKLTLVQSVLGQGPDAVPGDVLQRCREAKVPDFTCRKIDRFLNPRDDNAPVEVATTPDGYAVPPSGIEHPSEDLIAQAQADAKKLSDENAALRDRVAALDAAAKPADVPKVAQAETPHERRGR